MSKLKENGYVSLSIRIAVISGLIFFIAIASVSFLAIQSFRESTMAQSQGEVNGLADISALMVNRFLQDRISDATVIGQRRVLRAETTTLAEKQQLLAVISFISKNKLTRIRSRYPAISKPIPLA